MNAKEIIEGAIELLEDPSKWVEGVYGMDANNNAVPACDASAIKWCLHGALQKVSGRPCIRWRMDYNESRDSQVRGAFHAVAEAGYELYQESSLEQINEKGYAVVLDVLRYAYSGNNEELIV